ncbi:MAG: pyridoxal phosphate-dependent aminotransferase [Deltaproteobacteria bacterium]|nr:pyridoxal phosphate-dependent aminotransferase [Deltaproteobacteria bacterium]
MSLSQVARDLAPSPTLALNEQARLLRLKGEPVIHLGAGEPKNRAPVTALLGAAAVLKEGDIKYTPTEGIPELRKAVIRYTEESYGRLVAPENVIVSNGAKQALWNLLYTILNPQDEVVILAPYWVSYPEMVRMMYAVPVIVTPEDGTYHPRMRDIEQVVGSYTKAIVVNSPNNPTGLMYSRELIAEIVEFCEKKGIWLISDDIYHKLLFDGRSWPSPYQFTTKHLEDSRVVSINGVSKLYGMTGFRIGWAVAPRQLVEIMANVQGQTTSTASLVLQAAAASVLLGVQSHIESLRQMLENNCRVMLNELKTCRGLRCVPPDGTFYLLCDFRAYEADSVKLSKLLLDKARVVAVPGKEFGVEGHLRLSFCGTIKEIKEGIERIKWAIDPEAPNEIFIGERKFVRDWL